MTETKEHKDTVRLTIKVGLIGDSQIGKTSLMVKYVEGHYDQDYVQTLGVNFLEKTLQAKNGSIKLSIWDLGGQEEYLHMLPLVCNGAEALLFVFDLTQPSTLTGLKSWYRQVRMLNREAVPFLVGTKYDLFTDLALAEQTKIHDQAVKVAKAMKAPLVCCSAKSAVNVRTLFRVLLNRLMDLELPVTTINQIGEPVVMDLWRYPIRDIRRT